MRALVLGLTALLPALAQAEILEFNFTGDTSPYSVPPGQSQDWHGPGPVPSTVDLTFLVNTLSPGNSFQYTFRNFPQGTCVTTYSYTLATSHFNVSFDGHTYMHGGSGSAAGIDDSGALGCGGFLGAGLEATGATKSRVVTLSGGFDTQFPNSSQSALLSSKDPLGTFLDGSKYGFAPDVTGFGYPLSGTFGFLYAEVRSGDATFTAVPEPDFLGLFAAGGLSLMLFRRRPLHHP